ncbi:ATP-binding protein [Clostridium transplantifaecale]|uniref:ATP-binding protein n=1 Tax=Clostridium transplantifaecale TaxID=2479838 RepID=UPI000F62E635|nr:ATP-binding protein [Clostridium transplantifaecale]
MSKTVQGAPTKEFFVGMLTRDIELSDAILDLLDNCLDGVVRQKGALDKRTSPDYYNGYYSQITITNNSFIIEDNCGGIPREIAEKYAFRMGRSPEKFGDELPTVGIYGIGMKRAIFKIGRSALVSTRNNGELYQVIIPLNWAASDDDWNFSVNEPIFPELLTSGGTKIKIDNINPGIADIWSSKDKIDEYTERLVKSIQQSYSFIIQKGFKILINDHEVEPLPMQLLMDEAADGTGVKPFVYKQTFDDVSVSLVIGFYAPPPSPEDIDDENNLKRSSSDAGWTIVCNDRVVLYNDKSHLTGWGEAGIPQYHTQFIGIRGIVIFESNNPKNLPMTTTKRGVDTSSKIYSAVKDRMRQGLKMFTDYTNKWKGQNEEERKFSTKAKSVPVESLIATPIQSSDESPIKLRQNRGGFVFNPVLPKPHNDKPYKVIRYSKDSDEILDLVEYFYNDRNHSVTPSQIGEKCFDIILEQAKKTKDE